MKKIIKPAEKEDAVYYSDFSGKNFGELPPCVEVNIEFNYGSEYDGSSIQLHLTDDEVRLLLNLIRENISAEYKEILKKKLCKSDTQYEDSVESRDWESCDLIANSQALLTLLIKE